jgi:antitoxin ParD1/3/4
MPTSVALTPHFESLTQQLVSSGRYNNISEVVRDGLRLLESRVEEESAKLAALRDAAKLGFDAIERGESLALQTDQDIAGFVRRAGLVAKPVATLPSSARLKKLA